MVGIAAGFTAGVVDIGASWLQDLKEGSCHDAFYLNLPHCCWAEEVRIKGHRECDLWKSWADKSAIISGAYTFNYFVYICLATAFAGLSALLVNRLGPYAACSGIPETKTILSGFIIR